MRVGGGARQGGVAVDGGDSEEVDAGVEEGEEDGECVLRGERETGRR